MFPPSIATRTLTASLCWSRIAVERPVDVHCPGKPRRGSRLLPGMVLNMNVSNLTGDGYRTATETLYCGYMAITPDRCYLRHEAVDGVPDPRAGRGRRREAHGSAWTAAAARAAGAAPLARERGRFT